MAVVKGGYWYRWSVSVGLSSSSVVKARSVDKFSLRQRGCDRGVWVGLFVETVLFETKGCTLSGLLIKIRSAASQRLDSED